MAELFILEFEGFEKEDYEKVNSFLGVDMQSGEGDWPQGLLTHSAGRSDKGWMVVEVWESREAQERFMHERLGAALQKAGVEGPPARADWTTLHSHHQPNRKTGAGAS